MWLLQHRPFLSFFPPTSSITKSSGLHRKGKTSLHHAAFSQAGFSHSPCEWLKTARNLQLLHPLLILFQLNGSSTLIVSEEGTISCRDRQGNDWPRQACCCHHVSNHATPVNLHCSFVSVLQRCWEGMSWAQKDVAAWSHRTGKAVSANTESTLTNLPMLKSYPLLSSVLKATCESQKT